jgi:iron complex transport system substrate-binding protein
MTEHRIVTLIASATEIVAALGFEDRLVGRSHECDYPPSVLSLPACSEPKIDVRGSSREIDDRVKAVVKNGLSVYRVHTDVLDRLQPTVIVTQTQCEVCAVSLKDVEAAVCELVGSRPTIVSLEPMALADVWEDIHCVGEAIGAKPQALRLTEGLRARLRSIEESSTSLEPKPTIACIEWIDPLMAAGNWVPELVAIAGGVSLFGTAGAHSPWMTFEELLARDPDVIAIMPCGFDVERTRSEMAVLANRPEWHSLFAVRNGCVFLTDGNQYFNRPGPRLVESAEILAEILHPAAFAFGHEGIGWERL